MGFGGVPYNTTTIRNSKDKTLAVLEASIVDEQQMELERSADISK